MSQDQASDRASRRRRLIAALDSAQTAAVDEAPPMGFNGTPPAMPEPGPSKVTPGQEECIECDIIERRFGRRSAACAPPAPDGIEEIFALSRSARIDYGTDGAEALPASDAGTAHAAAASPALADLCLAAESSGGPDSTSGAATETLAGTRHDTQPWKDTFEELNAALKLAKSRLRAEGQSLVDGDRHEAWRDDGMGLGEGGGALRQQQPSNVPSPAMPGIASAPARPHQAATRRGRARVGSSSAGLLAGLAFLILAMGLLPFAPAVLGGLLEDGTHQGAAPGRWDSIAPASNQAGERRPAGISGRAAELKSALPGSGPAVRGQLAAARIHRVRAGTPVSLNIKSGLGGEEHAGGFAILRDFPAGATFSHGQPLGPRLWTVPLDQLSSLQVQVPTDSPDVSLMIIEALNSESILLAQSMAVIVVDQGAGGERARGNQVNAPRPNAIAKDVAFAPGTSQPAGDAEISLMTIARLQAPLRGSDMSWSNVEPRANLVHVVVSEPFTARAVATPLSLPDTNALAGAAEPAAPNPSGEAKSPANARDAEVTPPVRQPALPLRQEFGPAREAPYEAGPLRPSPSRGGSSAIQPSEGRHESRDAPPELVEDVEAQPRRLVRRIQKPEPEQANDAQHPADSRTKRETADRTAPATGSRANGGSPEQRLGGLAPRRRNPVIQPPAKTQGAPATPGLKWNGRQDMMEGNKGI